MAAPRPFTFDDELAFRSAAMEWLAVRTNDGAEPMNYLDIEDFRFEDDYIPLRNRYKGIWKPARFGAALSFTTKYTPPGKARPYEDAVGGDGLIRYKWRAGGPNIPDNRALRTAMQLRLPLIWFYGIAEGIYQPVFPVYLVAEEQEYEQFVVAIDEVHDLFVKHGGASPASALSEIEKRYAARTVRQRLHQPVFRSMVMNAYGKRCAVCALHQAALLDAAHIMPDSHAEGIAAVTNGLSLCKTHHSAFDQRFLGIRPDYVVEIREDLLANEDDPALRHGFHKFHGKPLLAIPGRRSHRPSAALLEQMYNAFKEAA